MIHEFDDYRIDDRKLSLTRNGKEIALQRLPRTVLLYLIRHRDRTVPTEELLDNVWPGRRAGRSSLARCINAIRSAIDGPEQTTSAIETAYGFGYRFARTVRSTSMQSPDTSRETPPEHLDSPGDLLKRGTALVASGQFEEARPLLLRGAILARESAQIEVFAEIAIAFAGAFVFLLPNEFACRLLEEAITRLGESSSPPLKARLEARLALQMAGNGNDAARDRLVESALQRSVGTQAADRICVLLDSARALEGLGSVDARRPLLGEAAGLLRRSGLVEFELSVALGETTLLLAPGTFPAFEAALERFADRAAAGREVRHRVFARCGQAAVAGLRGHYSEANTQLDLARALLGGSREDAVLVDGARWQIERRRETVPPSMAALRFPLDAPEALRPQMIQLMCDIGSFEKAREHLQKFKEAAPAALPTNLSFAMNVAALAESAVALEDVELAAFVCKQLARFEDDLVSASVGMILDPVSYYLGLMKTLLGRSHEAVQHLLAALSEAEVMGAHTTVARVHHALGVASPDPRDRSRHLERAFEQARAIDMPVLVKATAHRISSIAS